MLLSCFLTFFTLVLLSFFKKLSSYIIFSSRVLLSNACLFLVSRGHWGLIFVGCQIFYAVAFFGVGDIDGIELNIEDS